MKNPAIYIGKIEANPYGVPLDYQYTVSFKMNQFVLYLIQHQEELASRFATAVSEEFANSFMKSINNLDEFEFMSYHNLQLLDTSSLAFDHLKLEIFNSGIGLSNIEIELFFGYPFEIDLWCEGKRIDTSRFEKYQGQIVSLSFDQDFPLLFETTAQRENNQAYFNKLLAPIFEGLGLSMLSNIKEIEARFGIIN